MRALRLVPLLAAAAACRPSFPPRSDVFDTRVLAIEATPLEVGPTDAVTLRAYRVGPACEPPQPPPPEPPPPPIVSEQWSFCPFSLGSSAGYACAVPECEGTIALPPVPLETACGASSPLTATPGALAEQCLALLAGSGAIPPGVPAQLPDKIEVLFRYRVLGADGVSREAVQRIPLYPAGAPASPNLPPGILSVAIGAATWARGGPIPVDPPVLPRGGSLDVVATVDGAQPYEDGGRALTEQLVVSFYTTAGRFDYDRANGPVAAVKLKDEETAGATSAQIWVVARDLRGGETVGGPYDVAIAP